MAPAERLAALVFLLASALAASAALAPLDAGPSPAPDAPLAPRPATTGEPSRFLAAVPFDPARRPAAGSELLPVPPALEPAGQAAAAVPASAPVLAGVLVGDGRRKAMFEGAGGVWQEEGSLVGDWTVAAIEPGAVVLRRLGEERRLRSVDALR